jgi:hypothetical protein
MASWYILWPFGIFTNGYLVYLFPVLVCCTKKNLATLFLTGKVDGLASLTHLNFHSARSETWRF